MPQGQVNRFRKWLSNRLDWLSGRVGRLAEWLGELSDRVHPPSRAPGRLGEIVTAAVRAQNGMMADHVLRHNALLARVQDARKGK